MPDDTHCPPSVLINQVAEIKPLHYRVNEARQIVAPDKLIQRRRKEVAFTPMSRFEHDLRIHTRSIAG